MLGVAPRAFVRLDVLVGHLAERWLAAGAHERGPGRLPLGERVDLVNLHLLAQIGVFFASLLQCQFWIRAERGFALHAVEPVAKDEIGSGCA
jgi:hypothetical protein